MPKINTTSFKEGDVIRKSDITSIADEIEAIDLELDEDNIREEGLDRRVFHNNTWTSTPHSPVEIRNRVLLHRTTAGNWSLIEASGQMENSFDGVHPTIHIPWDTETDSDVIIRCSFFIETQGGDLDNFGADMDNDYLEFGLHVTHPNQSPDAELNLLPVDVGSGGIWPYTRMNLCKAFQRDAKIGGDGAEAPGAWWQHAFSKQSQISQSVTLVYHAHSRMVTPSVPISGSLDRSHRWFHDGTAKVSLAFRPNLPSASGILNIRIRGFNLSYQKFRR